MSRFYVVFKGHVTGVFDNWMQCSAQVDGFPSNLYQGFKTWEEANDAWKLYEREADQAAEIKAAIADACKNQVKKQSVDPKDCVIAVFLLVILVQMVAILAK